MTELQCPYPETIRVLLVEDNAADARLIGALLDDVSVPVFELTHATQLSHIPEALSRNRFDVILLDLSLPDAYGLDTVMRTQSISPRTPIVVMSNMGDEERAVQAVQIGAQDYLLKGFVDKNLLVRSIRYSIERKKTETMRENLLAELDQRVSDRAGELLRVNEKLQQEIEERERVEEGLSLERLKLKGILDAMSAGILIISRQFDLEYVNPVVEKEFGLVGNKKCYEYFHDRTEVCTWCRNEEVFAGKTIKWELSLFKTGKTYEMLDVPIRNHDGSVSKLQVFSDITDRKRSEEAIKESEKQLRYLSSQLMAAQENERKRISRELHDELGQSLTIIKMRLRFIQENLMNDQTILKDECEDSMLYINHVIENMRRLSQDLSPSILEDLGLAAALRWVIGNFAKKSTIQIAQDIADINHLLPQDSQIILYRILQEALTNIGKHSSAARASVVIRRHADRISFSVEDDGKGFDIGQTTLRYETQKGLGLNSMNERVRMLGGSLNVWSQEGKGTRLNFSIPINKEKDAL
jgi:signal transduction histidine kinase